VASRGYDKGMEMLADIVGNLAAEITASEGRARNRTADAQRNFEHALITIVQDCWKGLSISPDYESGIHKRAGYYSENRRYKDSNLTYRQTMSAFDGLVRLGFVEVTRDGFFDRDTGKGEITRYRPTDAFMETLKGIQADPFRSIKPDLSGECILLRQEIDGVKFLIDYEDDTTTNELRKNLVLINSCLARHWPDLRITNDEYANLQTRLLKDSEKQPVDFSKRTLVRIFSNGRFDQGGRFYRAWWHNVPSEYRKYITIDGKRTCEYDYSQLNPHMIYFMRSAKLGDEDAYSRVFDGEHRDIVKEAFNAMIQASTPLNHKPDDLELEESGIDWPTLKKAILDAHKPIADVFFQGHGNHLQYIDSCIAEKVMLQFVRSDDEPVLPVHDSFIMHHAFGEELGELEEAMRRAFYNQFKRDIKVSKDIGVMLPSSFDKRELEDLSLDEIASGPTEYSLWHSRNL